MGAVPGRPAPGGRVAEVLVPDRGVAPGLRRLLRELGLPVLRHTARELGRIGAAQQMEG